MKTGYIFCFLILLFFLMACRKTVSEQENVSPKSADLLSDNSSDATANRLGKEAPGFTPGQVLVKFKKGTTQQVVDEIQQELGLETVKVVSQPSLYLMKAKKDVSLEEMVKRLQRFEAVLYAEPNYTRTSQ